MLLITQSIFHRVENITEEERRKCWLPAFSPFPTRVFRRLLPQGHPKSSFSDKAVTNWLYLVCSLDLFVGLSPTKPMLKRTC